MAQRACVRTDAGRVVCGNLVREDNRQKAPNSNSSPVFEANGIRFALQQCLRRGNNVNCDVLMTNLENKDKEIYFSITQSRLIAVSGDQFSAEEVYIGGKRNVSYVGTKLVSQIPLKATISFKETPQSVTNLGLVEISYSLGLGAKRQAARFRNVVINPR